MSGLFALLGFLHFWDNMNQSDKSDNNSDRLWKMRILFGQLSDIFAEFYFTVHLI